MKKDVFQETLKEAIIRDYMQQLGQKLESAKPFQHSIQGRKTLRFAVSFLLSPAHATENDKHFLFLRQGDFNLLKPMLSSKAPIVGRLKIFITAPSFESAVHVRRNGVDIRVIPDEKILLPTPMILTNNGKNLIIGIHQGNQPFHAVLCARIDKNDALREQLQSAQNAFAVLLKRSIPISCFRQYISTSQKINVAPLIRDESHQR